MPENMSAKEKNVFIQILTPPKIKHLLRSNILLLNSHTLYTKHITFYLSLPINVTVSIFTVSAFIFLQGQLLKYRVYLKNQTMNRVPKEKTVSVNFSGALFSLLNFLIPVDGTNRLY